MTPALSSLLATLSPSPDALLELLCPRVDDAMLLHIAEADYATAVAENLSALRPIRDARDIPSPLAWYPREVLALTRWSEPDDPPREGPDRLRSHVARAFACAVLIRAGADAANDGIVELNGENTTAAQLVASAIALGPEVQRAALRLLAWRMQPDGRGERPFFAFAILVLACVLGRDCFPEPVLAAMADGVITEEADARASAYLAPPSAEWLLGLTYYDQRHSLWRALAHQVTAAAHDVKSEALRSDLLLLGGILAEPG